MVAVSKLTVDALIAAGQVGSIRDELLKGFVARLNRDGSVTYLFEYRAGRSRGAPWRRFAIGRHGKFTPTSARQAAEQLQARVRLGHDPALDTATDRGMPSVSGFALAFLAEAEVMARAHPEQAKLRLRTIANYRSYLRVHVAPVLGTRKLNTVTHADVEKLHTKVGRKHPSTANRVIEFVGTIWRAASATHKLAMADNPAAGISAFKETKRERFLTFEEIGRLGAAIREGETVGIPMQIDASKPSSKHAPQRTENRVNRLDPFAAAALRLLIFSGARLREILHAEWSRLDWDRGLLTVFGKTGRRHIVLPPPAMAIVAALPRSGPFIIPGEIEGKPRADLNRPWRLVSRRAGSTDVRLHDLRHSFASVAASGGTSLPIIGKLLGHSQPQTTQRYAHLADDPVQAAAQRAAERIDAAMGAKPASLRALPHVA